MKKCKLLNRQSGWDAKMFSDEYFLKGNKSNQQNNQIMLKNYIKIAWKVLQRRKFFTFISLFGISITLMVLMVLTSFIDHLISPNYPEMKRDRSLYVSYAKMSNVEKNNFWTGGAGFYFAKKYLTALKTPEQVAIASMQPMSVDAFSDNKKLKLSFKNTDANYWEVLEFDFLEGKPYNEQQLEDGAYVAVINEQTKKGYFGDTPNVVGKYIEVGTDKFRIIGVVKGVPITRLFSSADMYVPYTTSKSILKSKNLVGSYGAILVAKSSADFPVIKAELANLIPKIEMTDEGYTAFDAYADTYLTSITRIFEFGDDFTVNPFYLIIGIFSFLFMLLPAMNLINLNVSRIMERSSEIGVRKAFGAASNTLMVQFIVENLIITILGGVIGLLFTLIAISLLNNSGFIPHLDLAINLKVLFVSFLVCLFFGFMSGVLPAFRMSKMNVVAALKSGGE